MGKYKVWMYHDMDGKSPVEEFIEKVNQNQKSKIIKQFLYLTEFGVTQQTHASDISIALKRLRLI